MNALLNAMNQTGRTANGAATNLSSQSAVVDLFFLAGASRGKDITKAFERALGENEDLAIRILLWLRDAREGAGERDQFRNLLKYLVSTGRKELAERVLARTPFLGRWDDVVEFLNGELYPTAVRLIEGALEKQDGLCAKWMPRKGLLAVTLRQALNLSPKRYRKTLVNLSNTVEQAMCSGDWNDINFSHVPSVAAARYQKAFTRHDGERYSAYREELKKAPADRDPKVKINAKAIFPYDIVKSVRSGDRDVASAQWLALPNFLEGSDERLIVVADVSGSMSSPVSQGTTAMDVCISLAMYLAERLEGPFKDTFITFSQRPVLQRLKGPLYSRIEQLNKAQWDMDTNFEAVFNLILKAAVDNDVPQSEMPTKILAISDMEFNACGGSRVNSTLYDAISKKYALAGYEMPGIVFWTVNAREGNNPVTIRDANTALVSGFSPAIVKSVLGGKDMSPISVVLKTVGVDRYNY